jgi:hypothetical protein
MDIKALRSLRKRLVMICNKPEDVQRQHADAMFAATVAIELIDAISPMAAIDLPPCAPDWQDSSRLAPASRVVN